MLTKVHIDGVALPTLYLAQTKSDIEKAEQMGIPYIKWPKSHEAFLKLLLRPVLEQLFPGIKWTKVLGQKKKIESDVIIQPGTIVSDESEHEIAEYDHDAMLKVQLEHDSSNDVDPYAQPDEDGVYHRETGIAAWERDCTGGVDGGDYDTFNIERVSVYDYIGDISSQVDLDVLQKLGLLPKFVGDVADCIRCNLSESMRWTEGYTKKLGYPLGKMSNQGQLPNLIIIDVSYSIPDGIASTMLALADTLRHKCNAELIITSARSGYYDMSDELPDVQTLRSYYGRGNEAREFYAILEKHIAGREFGHVISFGDDDNPGCISKWHGIDIPKMEATRIHEVHHYHTWDKDCRTGYARWCSEMCSVDVEHFDTSWAKIMKN